jgi:hypothetical protein
MNQSEIIRYASNLSILPPLAHYLIILFKPGKVNSFAHAIGAAIIISLICDGVSFFLHSNNIKTVLIIDFYYIGTFIAGSWFFFEIVFKLYAKRTFIVASVAYFTVLILLIVSGIQDFKQYQNLAWTVEAMIFIIYSIGYFIYLFINLPNRQFGVASSVWFCFGFFFYFTMNLILFVLADWIFAQESNTSNMIWSLHNVVNIMKNIIFSIGLAVLINSKEEIGK